MWDGFRRSGCGGILFPFSEPGRVYSGSILSILRI